MPADMFQIKICGICTVEHALAAVEAGADAIGLNFYRNSVRCVSEEDAQRIAAEIDGRAARVGVFVNHAVEEIRRIVADVPLDWVQLHGDETPDFASELGGLRVIRAFRPHANELPSVDIFCQAAAELGHPIGAVLFDAPSRGSYGGTGAMGDWDAATAWSGESPDYHRPPLILAGGLTPENVKTAVEYVRPRAVDTASGVESSRGVKDSARIAEFVRAAREALQRIP